ncbi:MAG: patatin-like phospholipase family protein, partial [Hyphomicrobiales bacterium]|nr:patatin-like phospholipase family protein [Hyphomicrobiales bacterium]
TWGVLDKLLEDERVKIEAISGTSAGAINGVVLADGLMRGGPDAARDRLRMFWDKVAEKAAFSPFQSNPLEALYGNWSIAWSPVHAWFDALSRSLSPYKFNPLNINPLKDIIEELIDFEAVRNCPDFKLFISATDVETGRVRVFSGEELSADSVMASACLPNLFQAVEIDGKHYWDGGYMGNPVLFPFFYTSRSDDIVIVQINPVERKGVPRSSREILDRINEISFNASLLRELRAVEFVQRLLADHSIDSERYRDLKLHSIALHDDEKSFSAMSKLDANRLFLQNLFDHGRKSADAFLSCHYDAIGRHSTVNIRRMFEGDGYDDALM